MTFLIIPLQRLSCLAVEQSMINYSQVEGIINFLSEPQFTGYVSFYAKNRCNVIAFEELEKASDPGYAN